MNVPTARQPENSAQPSEPTRRAGAVIVIAHGSRSEPANAAHIAACARLAESAGIAVLPAFLELARPSLDDAVQSAADAGHRRVSVLPFFLYPGRHSTEDIPRLVAAATESHPELDLSTMELFGADPALLGLLVDQIRS